jgi:hypothetical protein
LYEFIETAITLSGHEIMECIGRVVTDQSEKDRLFDILLWYGIFGVVRSDEEVSYIHDVRYDMKLLRGLMRRRGGLDATFRLNPAFWKALEVRM